MQWRHSPYRCHQSDICSFVPITSQNGTVSACWRESRCEGIMSPVWSKHPLQTLRRLRSFACQQPAHKKLLGSGADKAEAAPFPWLEVAHLVPELSLSPLFLPLYPLSPSAALLLKVLISSMTSTCTESAVGSSPGSWWRGGTSGLEYVLFSQFWGQAFSWGKKKKKKEHF